MAAAAGAVLEAEEGRSRQGATGAPPAGEGLLEVRALEVARGSQPVLFGVDLDVAAGELVAVLGPNGAGKSTLLAAVSGLLRARGGTIRFAGEELRSVDAAGRVALGIVQMPGGRAVFPRLTVLDNLLVGCQPFAWDRDRVEARIGRVMDLFPPLASRLDQAAGTLSGGEQQMLGLGKALLLEPRLLLIDELSLGLAPVVVQELVQVIAGLKAAGTTMVVVEQSVNVALSIADRAAWMEKGAIRRVSPAAELQEALRAGFPGSLG
ncbi:MAG TPA: ABC transporter ATP-binding protein [Acidimicrobiales bacterium]